MSALFNCYSNNFIDECGGVQYKAAHHHNTSTGEDGWISDSAGDGRSELRLHRPEGVR